MQSHPLRDSMRVFEVDFILIALQKRALQTVVIGVKEFFFVADCAEKLEVLTQSDTWDDRIQSRMAPKNAAALSLCNFCAFCVVSLLML